MSKIQLTPAELKAQAAQMEALSTEYDALFGNVVTELRSVNGNWSPNLAHNFSGKITSAQNKFRHITDMLSEGAKAANAGATAFENTDKVLSILYKTGIDVSSFPGGVASAVMNTALGIADSIGGAVAGASAGEDLTEDERSWFAKLLNNELVAEGSVLGGEVSGDGTFLGFNTSGTASGDLLYGSAGLKGKASWGFDKSTGKWDFKKFGFGLDAFANASLAKGEVSGNVGYLHGKLGGSVGNVGVKAKANATLWDKDGFNPSLMIGAEASASVAHGEAEVGFGNDQYGIYTKADGDVLYASAEAGAGIGYLGVDKDGKKMYGAKAEAKAMACLAQGKVKGGFTLFGIDIDLGVKGYAGAAGVEAGGSVTTNGVTASFGGSLGLGAGMDISVDWSDAKWIGDAADAVGDFAGDVYDFGKEAADVIGDAAKDIGEAAVDFGKDVGKAAKEFGGEVMDAAEEVGDFLFGWL